MPEGSACLPDEAHEALIRVAQVYLQHRFQALEPGALITLYWEEFYRLYSPMVQRRLRRRFPEPAERDDVCQEIWLTIARRLPGFQWVEGSRGVRQCGQGVAGPSQAAGAGLAELVSQDAGAVAAGRVVARTKSSLRSGCRRRRDGGTHTI